MSKKIVGNLDWIAALLITLAAVWLHFSFLTHAGGLWRDEVNLINLANQPSLDGMSRDSFPLLMPVAVKVWSTIGLGRSDLALRGLGFLIGLGSLGALWAATWFTGRRPPLLGLALLALNPTVIIYGDSLRAYGLGSVLIMLCLPAMWRFLKSPTFARGLLLTAAAILSVQTLFHNAVLIAAICLGAWAFCVRRRNSRIAVWILIIAVAAAASLLPYSSRLLFTHESTGGLRSGLHLLTALPNLTSTIGFPLQQYTYVWALLAGLTIVGGCFAGTVAVRNSSHVPEPETDAGDRGLFIAVTLLTGIVGFAVFLWFAALAPQPWYFLPVMALSAICLDNWHPLGWRRYRLIAGAIAIGTALIAFPLTHISTLSRMTNADVIARRLATEASPKDFIVVTPWHCGISFNHYYTGPAAWMTVPPIADHQFHRFDLVRPLLGKPDAIQPILDQISAALKSGQSVWVVGWIQIPPAGKPAPADLPPPPLKPSGWSDTPYTANWTAQIAAFLQTHSSEFELITSSSPSDVNAYENLKLVRAKGWKSP